MATSHDDASLSQPATEAKNRKAWKQGPRFHREIHVAGCNFVHNPFEKRSVIATNEGQLGGAAPCYSLEISG